VDRVARRPVVEDERGRRLTAIRAPPLMIVRFRDVGQPSGSFSVRAMTSMPRNGRLKEYSSYF
jgi:hypothetical protein